MRRIGSNWSSNRFHCSIIRLFEKFVRWPIITRIFEPIFEPIFELILEPIFESILLFDYLIIWKIREMANHYKNLRTDFIVRLFDYSIIWEICEMTNHYKNLRTDLRTDLGTWISLFDYTIIWEICEMIIITRIFEPISLFDYAIIWEICEKVNHYKNLRTDFTVRLCDYLKNLWDGQSLQESSNQFHCSIIRFEKFVRWPIITRIWTDLRTDLWTDLRTDLGTNFWIDFTVRLFDYLKNSWDGQSLQESSNWSSNRFSNRSSNRFHCSIIRLFDYLRNLWDGQSLEESILFLFDVYSI